MYTVYECINKFKDDNSGMFVTVKREASEDNGEFLVVDKVKVVSSDGGGTETGYFDCEGFYLVRKDQVTKLCPFRFTSWR